MTPRELALLRWRDAHPNRFTRERLLLRALESRTIARALYVGASNDNGRPFAA